MTIKQQNNARYGNNNSITFLNLSGRLAPRLIGWDKTLFVPQTSPVLKKLVLDSNEEVLFW